MATDAAAPAALVFPHHQRTRLRVSLSTSKGGEVQRMAHNTIHVASNGSLDGSLRVAQQEVVEQEIFSVLVKEASNLPTASARVSERLIVIDAAQGIELRFELVSYDFRNTFRNLPKIFDILGGHRYIRIFTIRRIRSWGYLWEMRPYIFDPPCATPSHACPLQNSPSWKCGYHAHS